MLGALWPAPNIDKSQLFANEARPGLTDVELKPDRHGPHHRSASNCSFCFERIGEGLAEHENVGDV
jgi:hypothetical protein